MDKPNSCGPLVIAVALLLLPLLYVGSYLALVVPGGVQIPVYDSSRSYRFGEPVAEVAYWPLEKIDQKVRPRAWVRSLYMPVTPKIRIQEEREELLGIEFE